MNGSGYPAGIGGAELDGPQVLLVTVEGGRVRAIVQFVGDPPAVAAFWA